VFLGVDLGTTNVKAVAVDSHGRMAAEGAAAVLRFSSPNGGMEQDIEQIWDAARTAIQQVTSAVSSREIKALGVSSQGAALQPLDVEGNPLGRVIGWLDARGADHDRRTTAAWGRDFFAQHLGHASSALTIGQVLRLRDSDPSALRPPQQIGFVGDVIVGRLSGCRAHDPTSLGIAMLYNPWLSRADPETLARLEIDELQLPALSPANVPCGGLRESAARQLGLTAGIPVSPAIHDQYAASLGAGAVEAGDVNFGAGTAWVILANAPRLAPPITAQAFVCAHLVEGLFGQLLSLGNGGSVIDWAMRLLGHKHVGIGDVDALIDRSPPLSHGLRCWPFMAAGCNVPEEFTRGGRLAGLQLSHGSGDFIRAVLEGLACELARYLQLLRDAGLSVRRLTMCGPGAASRHAPQIVANLARIPVMCVDAPDVSAWGAALVARSLVEPHVSLATIAREWKPAQTLVIPNCDAPAYRELLEYYLVPFNGGRNLE
jgi:xylulokinase